jgi:uncharacterized SAM-binding protein YcdF (DUF218 family)
MTVSLAARTGWPFTREQVPTLFFFLSKTLGVLLIPSNFVIAIGALGLILIRSRYRTLGQKLLASCVAALLICGYLPIGNLLLVPLETRFSPWKAEDGAPTGLIVLGGGIDPVLSAAHGTPAFDSAGARIVVAAALAHQYPRARVVYTGGSANLIRNEAREADAAAAVFESLGIARNRVQIERQSRNTQENVEFSKAIADPKPGERWLLVTSAFHMPRSIGLFRKAGFAVEPYPVDWRTFGWSDAFALQNDFLNGLSLTNLAVREWLGLIAYRLTGRIDQLFPSPTKAGQQH